MTDTKFLIYLIEGRERAPLNYLKGQPKGESTDKLAWKLKLDHCFMSKSLEGRNFHLCKENPIDS